MFISLLGDVTHTHTQTHAFLNVYIYIYKIGNNSSTVIMCLSTQYDVAETV